MIGSESLGSLSRTHGDERLMRIQKSNPDGKNKRFERHLKDESDKDGDHDTSKNEDTYLSLKESEPKKATTKEVIQSAERLEDVAHPLEDEKKTEDTYQSLKENEPKKATTKEVIQSAEKLEDVAHPLKDEKKTEETKSGDGTEHIDLTA